MKPNLLIASVTLLLLTGGVASASPPVGPVLRLAAASEAELFKLGFDQSTENDHAKAIETFSELLKLNPRHMMALRLRGDNYAALDNHAAALADYEQTLALDASDDNRVRVQIGRGEVYLRQKLFDKALAEFDPAIRTLAGLDATAKMAYLHRAHFGRARVYAAQGKTELARADFGLITSNRFSALKTYFEEQARFETSVRQAAEAQVKLAIQKIEQQDLKGAKAALDECLRVEPQALPCYVYRAQLQIRQGAPEPALKDLDRALALNPKEPQLYYLRALIYANTGKRDSAITDLRQALKLKPDYKEAADGLRQMGVAP